MEGAGGGSFEGEKEICTKPLTVLCSVICSPLGEGGESGGREQAVPPAPEPHRPLQCDAERTVPAGAVPPQLLPAPQTRPWFPLAERSRAK